MHQQPPHTPLCLSTRAAKSGQVVSSRGLVLKPLIVARPGTLRQTCCRHVARQPSHRVARETSMPADDPKGKLASRPLLVALLTVLTATAGAAPARADGLRDVVERTLSASYVFVALRVGSSIAPGSQQWTESLEASVD